MPEPKEFLRFPTLDDPCISPIEAPSTDELYALYGDLILEVMAMEIDIDDRIRKAISTVLNAKFFENPQVEEGSELWLTGAQAIHTRDRTMIREIAENEVGGPIPDDELPYVVGYPLQGTESIQGFFISLSISPFAKVELESGDLLDLGFCVAVENPVIKIPASDQPEFLVGNWIVAMGLDSTIGVVS